MTMTQADNRFYRTAADAALLEDPEKLLTLLHVCADAYGVEWHQASYPAQVEAARLLLHVMFPAFRKAGEPR